MTKRKSVTGPFTGLHAHIPLPFLEEKLAVLIENGVSPEVYFNFGSLHQFTSSKIAPLAEMIKGHKLEVTIHGPFFDLSPGAVDPGFRKLTADRMILALARARPFAPKNVIFHSGYDPLRFQEHQKAWLKNSRRTWNDLLPLTKELPDTWILIENIFERNPSTLVELLDSLPSPPFGFCLDTGHFQVFSEVPLEEWTGALGGFLREVHIHDNHGVSDEHLPPGRGLFNFDALFSEISSLGHPVVGTVEAHSENDLVESVSWLRKRWDAT